MVVCSEMGESKTGAHITVKGSSPETTKSHSPLLMRIFPPNYYFKSVFPGTYRFPVRNQLYLLKAGFLENSWGKEGKETSFVESNI